VPFIVTTRIPADPDDHHNAMCEAAGFNTDEVHRYAVATLEDARSAAYSIISQNAIGQSGDAWRRAANLVNHPAWPYLERSTVPLPDGTTVEARQVTWRQLEAKADMLDHDHDADDTDAILAAFNQ